MTDQRRPEPYLVLWIHAGSIQMADLATELEARAKAKEIVQSGHFEPGDSIQITFKAGTLTWIPVLRPEDVRQWIEEAPFA